jgi:predicted ATP-grasp superfamily ATP-dependent carboligase
MKQDPITGQFLIIEPNIGRPTGRSATAEAAGVELIYSMYCDALGLPLPENLQQQFFGVKWIHWRRDVQAALHAWRNGQLNLRDMWRSWQGRKVDAIFSWRDPLPFVFDLLRGCRQLFWWSVDDQHSV